jgi:DNA-binding PadR family transcriptional regulator
MTADYLGEFEQLVLLAILRRGDDAYGVTIAREIEDTTERRVSIGAIYTTLDRLHGKGLVASRIGPPTGERGGRRRKLYTLTPAGQKALARAFESWTAMTRGLKGRIQP